ncbi:hypothetical protein IHQ52_22745 [Gordonia amicalis]|nr:hypothetical protein [Gordonia amicalis]UKO91724.1 hypothetical protein IHQ52_22745 [Gordonia amicalis]
MVTTNAVREDPIEPGLDGPETNEAAACHLPLLWDRLDCHEDGTTLARY